MVGLGNAHWNPANSDDRIEIQLYYLDGEAPVVVASATAIASILNDSQANLTDFSARLVTVEAGAAWAGKNIGIRILSAFEGPAGGSGDWIFDNVRLTATAIPEPSTLALVTLCGVGIITGRKRRS